MRNYFQVQLVGMLLFTCLSWLPLNGQVSFENADAIAIAFNQSVKSVEELAQALTKELDTDIEKARVFYMWIVNNVRYDCRKFHKPSSPTFQARSEKEYKEKLHAWKMEQVEKTVTKKKGVCEDYSMLYKALCDEVGLECVVVTGDSRDFFKPYRKSHDNPHAWNAVKIENEWHLLDATWGAGYTDAGVSKFTRRVSLGFFLTPPAWFVQNHLPDDEKWQLLEKPISSKDFANQPMVNYGDVKYQIKAFSPKPIESKGNSGQVEVWLAFENRPPAIVVASKNGKKVKFTIQEREEKVILTFSKSASRNVVIYGGESMRSKMGWLANYKL